MKRRPARASITGSPHREQGGGRAKYEEDQPPTQAALLEAVLSEYRSEGCGKRGGMTLKPEPRGEKQVCLS